MLALAGAFGLADVEVSATPTLVEVSLGSLPRQRNYSLRVRPTPVDLDAIARLDGLVEDALDGRLDADDARAGAGEKSRTTRSTVPGRSCSPPMRSRAAR